MRRRLSIAGVAAMLASAAGVTSVTARADTSVSLANSVLHHLDRATAVGGTDPARVIGLGMSLSRPNPSGEATYRQQIYDPSSPLYHHFLTPAAFDAQFGVPPSRQQALMTWLKKGGLAVQVIPGASDYLTASGTVGAIERLLQVRFSDFTFNGTSFYAAATAPTVPASIGIAGITGLNNLEGPRLLPRQGTAPKAIQRPAVVGPNTNMGLTTPYDLWAVYHQPSNNLGDGQQMAIFGWGTTNNTLSDMRQFEREYSFPAMPLTVNYYGTESAITDKGGEPEWNIDTQASSGMAPHAAALKMYFGKAGTDPDLIAAYNAWTGDANGPLQGSSSFSGCEEAPGTDTFGGGPGNPGSVLTIANAMQDQYEAALSKAVTEGRTMFASTGDTGSGCPALSLLLNGVTLVPTPQQGYPAISPNAVGVGGTVLYWDGGGSTPSTGATATRSLEYSWTHTGGGTSLFLQAPAYQQGVPTIVGHCISDPHGNPYVPAFPLCRGNPDVAAQSGDVIGNGYTVTMGGTNDQAGGGTSLSSPLWLGMWTRVQAAATNPAGNGFANNSFYAIGKDATKDANDFFDIGSASTETVVSCNGANCSHVGWDYTSGWGSPNLTGLMTDLDGKTAPTNSPTVAAVPPPPPPDTDTHGGNSCPGPQVVDATGDAINNTPGAPPTGTNTPNYDLVNSTFSQPDASTLRVTIAVTDLEGSPNGPNDANLGEVWISGLWSYNNKTYDALAKSTGPNSTAAWSFSYGVYDGNLFHNQTAAKASSHATNGTYAGGAAGTVVIDVPLSGIGSPPPGDMLSSLRIESHGGPAGDATYWTTAVDRGPDSGYGAPFVIGQSCPAANVPEVGYTPALVVGGAAVFVLVGARRRRGGTLAGV